MSLINDIAELMLREGDINAQEKREIIAAQEEQRQNKWYNRPLRNTLKAVATVAPLFIPGGPLAGLFGEKWAGLADSPIDKILRGGMTPPIVPRNTGVSPGRVPAGLGYNQFFGPMGRNDWYQTPWDEEGVG